MKFKGFMAGLAMVLFVTMLFREAYYFASNMYLKHNFTMLSSLDEKGAGIAKLTSFINMKNGTICTIEPYSNSVKNTTKDTAILNAYLKQTNFTGYENMQVVAIVNDDVVHIHDLHYRTWSPIQFVGVDGECIDIATAYIKEDMANNFLIVKGKVRQRN